jgi:hypothetical protein
MPMLLLAAAALAVISISVPATFDTAEGYYARRGTTVGPRAAARRTKIYIRCARRTITCVPPESNWMSCYDTCR